MFSDLSRDAVLLYERVNKSVRLFRIPLDEWKQKANRKQDTEDTIPGKYVVVKLFSHPPADAKSQAGSWMSDSIRREVFALSQLLPIQDSTILRGHVPRLIAFKNAAPTSWIGTNYFRAVPLQKLFVSGEIGSSLPRALIAGIVAQLAMILSVLHSKGIVHRDVKLPNVLLEPSSGRVILVDFGCSATTKIGEDDSSMPFSMILPVGTLHIRAPEMYRPVDGFSAAHGSVDVYAVGCLIVELLTGKPAFGSFESSEESGARSLSEVAEAIVKCPHSRKKPQNLEENAIAADLVGQLLQQDPPKRPGACAPSGKWLPRLLAHKFFRVCAGREVRENKEGLAKSHPIESIEEWSIVQWSELCLSVINGFENVEEELEMQLLGM